MTGISDTNPLAISLNKVTKSFGTFKAIDNVSLDVRTGEVFGFLGPNGAGKSTTIRLLLDLLRADSGTISLLGKDSRDTKAVHMHIGFLSGDMTFDTDLTGKQYLGFINALHGGGHETETERLSTLLEADLDKKIGDYSRGNRQKIGLIAALLHRPKLLVLDEPTTGFDPLVQEKFAQIIRSHVVGGGTVFMSSHVLAEVQHLCDRVAFIKDGKIISVSSVHELLDTTVKRVVITAPAAEIRAIQTDIASRPGTASPASLAGLSLVSATDSSLTCTYSGTPQALLRYFAGRKITDITIREPELEEIFGQYYETAPSSAKKELRNA